MKSYYQEAFALGCDIGLCLVYDSEAEANSIFESLWNTIGKFEADFSRFLPDSELTIFNQNAGKPQLVSDDFYQMLELANAYTESTDGVFNLFILPALQKVGYAQSFNAKAALPSSTDFSTRKFSIVNKVKLDKNTAETPSDSAIDLGGIAKGFLADKLADYVENEVYGYWFSIGGDIVVGGKNQLDEQWLIGIDSVDSNQRLEVGINHDRYAVATSGISKRHGVKNNKPWHHIIDPRTGKPSNQNVIQATVVARTAVEADVLATCTVIVNAATAKKLLNKHKVIDGLMQTMSKSSEVHMVQLNNVIKHYETSANKGSATKEMTHA